MNLYLAYNFGLHHDMLLFKQIMRASLLSILSPSSHHMLRSPLLGTLRNQDEAIGRRLLLRHLITTSGQKESLNLIPTQVLKTAAETCLAALSKSAKMETEYDGL